MCKSILLESAIKKMLKEFVTTFNECDVVLSDQNLNIKKPYLLISSKQNSDIKKPFTRTSLMLQLEKFAKTNILYKNLDLPKELERKIDNVINDFSLKLDKIIKTHA